MVFKQHDFSLLKLVLTFLGLLLGVVPCANAADPISIDNLQAAVQTLNFLESLPKERPINVAVIYASEIANSQQLAAEAVKAIGTMHGPNKREVKAVGISIDDLSHYAGHPDVMYLLIGASNHSDAVTTQPPDTAVLHKK